MKSKEPEGLDSSSTKQEVVNTPASPLLWVSAVLAYGAFLGVNLEVAVLTGKSGEELIGYGIGLSIWPIGAVIISSRWKKNRTQRTRVKVFFVTSLILFGLAVATFLSVSGYSAYSGR